MNSSFKAFTDDICAAPAFSPNPLMVWCHLPVLQCGFVAPAAAATDFNSLTPFFVPEESNRPCFCRQSYDIDLFNDGVLAPLGQPVPLPTPQQAVRGLANAFEEVFGGKRWPWSACSLALASS